MLNETFGQDLLSLLSLSFTACPFPIEQNVPGIVGDFESCYNLSDYSGAMLVITNQKGRYEKTKVIYVYQSAPTEAFSLSSSGQKSP